jgi:hypothetical protein
MPSSTAARTMLAAACVLAAAAVQPKPSVRLYVYAAEPAPGPGQRTQSGRDEAVRDMRDALARKAGLEIVDARTSADVLVEVIGREEREGPRGGFGGVSVTKMGDFIIRLRLRAGDDEAELKGMGQGSWGRAAKDGADRVLKWIARRERTTPS